MEPIGHKCWAIAEGYIASASSFSHRTLICHETACILNAGNRDAHERIFVFFADREPVGPYNVTVTARRTLHLRFNDLKNRAPIPCDTNYASVFESDIPILPLTRAARFASRRVKSAFDKWLTQKREVHCCIGVRQICRVDPDGNTRN